MSLADEIQKANLAARARALGVEPWQLEAMDAVGDATVRGIVADNRRPIHERASTARQPEPQPTPPNQATRDIPPGIGLIDRMMDAQDAIDRAERAAKLSGAGLRE